MSNQRVQRNAKASAILRASYAHCRNLTKQYGSTYFLATQLLPPHKRWPVYSLYGFARAADEIVDLMDSTVTPEMRTRALDSYFERFFSDLNSGQSVHPVFAATVDTVNRWNIDHSLFADFSQSMTMDLTIDRYQTFSDLMTYMRGSAAAIGLQMLPILEPVSPSDPAAQESAAALGNAFQLTNFLRDVGEDLQRGRIYLPLDDLARFDVSQSDLTDCVREGRSSLAMKALVRYEIARVRQFQDIARTGLPLLHPSSRPCIDAALTLYCGIADEIERRDYEVLDKRVRVGRARKIRVAGKAWVSALVARRRHGSPASSASHLSGDRALPTSTE